MIVLLTVITLFYICNLIFFYILMNLQYMPYCNVKGAVFIDKRRPFGMQNNAFCILVAYFLYVNGMKTNFYLKL